MKKKKLNEINKKRYNFKSSYKGYTIQKLYGHIGKTDNQKVIVLNN